MILGIFNFTEFRKNLNADISAIVRNIYCSMKILFYFQPFF